MPDVKDKNSGSRLNPSERNFDDIVKQPDLQALDDQGDAIARDDEKAKLRGGENDAAASSENREGGETPEPAKRPENNYYNQPTKQENTKTNLPSRRNFWIAAGAGGGTVAALIAGFMALTTLKVPGIMNMVTSATTQRMENIVEERAKLILGRAILHKFGSHTNIVLTGNGPVSTLIASMRTNGLEKRLAAKGLVITQTPNGVKLTSNGRPLGGGQSLNNERAVLQALDGDPLTRKMVREIIKEEIPAWRWFKRVKFARWLSIKHNIPYGLKNSQETDPEKREADVQRQRKATDDARLKGFFSKFITCLSAGKCEGVNSSGEAEDLGDNMGAVENAVAEATTETVEDITQSARKTLISKLSSKAIPIVGWIDLFATIDHFINLGLGGKNDFMGELVAYQKGLAYGAVYTEWAGYGSQIELGAMAPDHVGMLSDSLNDAETAEAFQTIQKNSATAGGVPIETTVNSNDSSNVKELYDNIVNSPFGKPYELVGHPVLNAYYETIGGGGLLGWAFSKIGDLASDILKTPTKYGIKIIGAVTPESVEKAIENTLYDIAPIILKSIGVTISSLEKGAGLVNNIVGGGVVSGNEYCKEMGCRKLSTTQANEQNRQTEADRVAYRQEKGLFYSLFSTEEPTSISSQLAVHTPTEPTAALTTIGRLVSSVPSKLTGIIFPKAFAENHTALEDIYEVAPYGATKNDLNQPVAPEASSGDDCPEVIQDDYNTCSIDKETAESMLCNYDSENSECSNSESAVLPDELTSGEGTSFRIATFNITVKTNEVGWAKSIKAMTDRKLDIIGTQELEKDANYFYIKENVKAAGYGIFPDKKRNENIVRHGLNARSILYRNDKFELMKTDMFRIPRYTDGPAQSGDEQILQGQANVPIVWLRDRTTQQVVIVMNTHNVAFAEFSERRYQSGLIYVEQIKRLNLENPGVPILFTGDFNEGTGVRGPGDGANFTYQQKYQNLMYCMFASNKLMISTEALSKGRQTSCPNSSIGGVDYIYASPTVQAKNFTEIPRSISGSDHPAKYVDIVVPGSGGSTKAAGGWSWPLGKQAWEKYRSAFVKEHSTGGGYYDQGNSSSDISWGPTDTGAPIYSMLDGVVKTQPLGRSSRICVGTPNTDNNGGMEVVSTVNGKTVEIVYAHAYAPEYNAGQSVKSGEQILKLGNVGNSCGSHLHMNIAYGGKSVCPQDVFIALSKGQEPNLEELVGKATPMCEGR